MAGQPAPVVPALRTLLEASWPHPVEALTVVDGAMDAHSQFVAAHLRFGDRVAVEQPCFPPLLDLVEMAGAVPIGVGYDAEGFVHFSFAEQLDGTRAAHYADLADDELVLLELDAAALELPVIVEPGRGELFPHLFAPLPVADVVVHPADWRP